MGLSFRKKLFCFYETDRFPLSFFSALLLSLPFAFHILSGFPKELGVNYEQSLEMVDLDQL